MEPFFALVKRIENLNAWVRYFNFQFSQSVLLVNFPSLRRGFTLMELLVTCGILVVVSAIVLVNNGKFGGQVLLDNLAYDIALSVRQAQTYGISTLRHGEDTFSAAYGIHMQRSASSQYVTFADVVVNGVYDPNLNELVSTTALQSGYFISSICAPAGADIASCTGLDSVDITFKRPDPDAWISTNGISCNADPSTCAASVRIVIQSPRGDHSSVIVSANGQISVTRK